MGEAYYMLERSCFECDSTEELIDHHVVPRILGGIRTLCLCESCHGKVHSIKTISHSKLTKIGLAKLRKEKRRISRTPYGFDLASDGKHLTDNLEEQKVISQILSMRKDGLSFPKIAKKLSDMQIPTKRNNKIWGQGTVNGIIRRWATESDLKEFKCRHRRKS